MTLPEERVRAVQNTRAFLFSLLTRKRIPKEVREEARILLKHYPGPGDEPAQKPGTLTLTLTADQAWVVAEACDLYHRLWMGQYWHLWDMVGEPAIAHELKRGVELPLGEACHRGEQFRALTFQLAQVIHPDWVAGHSYGVGGPLPKEAQRAYEIFKVVTYARFQLIQDTSTPAYLLNRDPYLLNFSGDPKIPFEVRRA